MSKRLLDVEKWQASSRVSAPEVFRQVYTNDQSWKIRYGSFSKQDKVLRFRQSKFSSDCLYRFRSSVIQNNSSGFVCSKKSSSLSQDPHSTIAVRWFLKSSSLWTSIFSATNSEKLSAMCYYALVRQEDTGTNFHAGAQDKYTSNDFIVCFITSSDVLLDLYPFVPSGMLQQRTQQFRLLIRTKFVFVQQTFLDSPTFKPELDKYTGKLHSLLEADVSEPIRVEDVFLIFLLAEVDVLKRCDPQWEVKNPAISSFKISFQPFFIYELEDTNKVLAVTIVIWSFPFVSDWTLTRPKKNLVFWCIVPKHEQPAHSRQFDTRNQWNTVLWQLIFFLCSACICSLNLEPWSVFSGRWDVNKPFSFLTKRMYMNEKNLLHAGPHKNQSSMIY